jgi:enterochelin esterase-like enzyme
VNVSPLAAVPRTGLTDSRLNDLSVEHAMHGDERCLLRLFLRAAFALGLLLCAVQSSSAGEAILTNGIRIPGKPVPVQALTLRLVRQKGGPTTTYPILMVDTGMARYFIGKKHVADIDHSVEFSPFETFKLKQTISGRTRMFHSIGSYIDVTSFDEFGRRRVALRTAHGREDVIQGIKRIHPRHLTVTALSHNWEHGLATTSIRPEILDRMIRKVTDQSDPDERLAIARFYLQAEMYRQAAAELRSIKRDFPELAARVDEVGTNLRQLQAAQLLAELGRRRTAGQHNLAAAAIRSFPTEGMSAVVLRQVRDFESADRKQREELAAVRMLLGDLQAQLTNAKDKSSAAMFRSIINRELDLESLERLGAFLKLSGDDTLSPKQKLALAYSGWVLGSAQAVTEFDTAVRLWDARFLVLEYLRARTIRQRDDLYRQLELLEGINPDTVGQLIPQLPPPVETPGAESGVALEIEVAAGQIKPKRSANEDPKQTTRRYTVLLPSEYSPHHRYPLIVALHPPERTPADELKWWGGTREKPGQSQRHGYIVIAPSYADKTLTKYDYDTRSHAIVLAAINDARKRFQIDSDRIFLSGHGMGGTAAFDIGMSHPEIFAGVLPICGFAEVFGKWYWRNAKSVPWYVVGGEFDRDTMARNSNVLNRMLKNNYDLIYAEYIGRGYESYYAEIHKLFDWMDRQTRAALPKQFEAQVLREADDRFHWVECHGLPRNVLLAAANARAGSGRVRPMSLEVKITDGLPGRSTIHIRSGAKQNVLWLSSAIIDFDKRVSVRLNGRPVRIAGQPKFAGFLRPSVRTMLDDLRVRGDRQRVYQVRLPI